MAFFSFVNEYGMLNKKERMGTMFRELVRKHKQLPADTCIEVLKSETRGVLSVNGDDGYPYGAPINH